MAKAEENWPARLSETWRWFVAVYSFDYGDREPLAELMRSREPVPDEYRAALADIIEGKRKPNMKAASKLSVPARERMDMALRIQNERTLIDFFKPHAAYFAEKQTPNVETKTIKQDMEQAYRDAIHRAEKHFDAKWEAIENILREFKKRVDRWPVV